MHTICVVTGTRAEYGLLYWLLREIRQDQELRLQLVVTGQHLSPRFGSTVRCIEDDGFTIDEKIELPLDDDSAVGVAAAIGTATAGLGRAFARLAPGVVVLLGDRFEMLAAATAATVARYPIAHIHGGEVTEGSFDNAIRHAITKMAHLHFAAAEPYRRRIIGMGESPDRVFCVGAPGLDHLAHLPLMDRPTLENALQFPLKEPLFLVTLHPETLSAQSPDAQIRPLLEALDAFPEATVIFTGTNADPHNAAIREGIAAWVDRRRPRACYVESLGYQRYLSLLQFVSVVIGNSSSGIIEVPAFRKPTVNIGARQKGRLMADSVINCDGTAGAIRAAIHEALGPAMQRRLPEVRNPYQQDQQVGGVARGIKDLLKEMLLHGLTLHKPFYEAAQ